jgi:hypothetical protein
LVSVTTPISITTDGTSLYITYPTMIRKVVLQTGTVSTIAGGGTNGATDGLGTAASFGFPSGITTDGKSLYLCDVRNNTIRRVF